MRLGVLPWVSLWARPLFEACWLLLALPLLSLVGLVGSLYFEVVHHRVISSQDAVEDTLRRRLLGILDVLAVDLRLKLFPSRRKYHLEDVQACTVGPRGGDEVVDRLRPVLTITMLLQHRDRHLFVRWITSLFSLASSRLDKCRSVLEFGRS